MKILLYLFAPMEAEALIRIWKCSRLTHYPARRRDIFLRTQAESESLMLYKVFIFLFYSSHVSPALSSFMQDNFGQIMGIFVQRYSLQGHNTPSPAHKKAWRICLRLHRQTSLSSGVFTLASLGAGGGGKLYLSIQPAPLIQRVSRGHLEHLENCSVGQG